MEASGVADSWAGLAGCEDDAAAAWSGPLARACAGISVAFRCGCSDSSAQTGAPLGASHFRNDDPPFSRGETPLSKGRLKRPVCSSGERSFPPILDMSQTIATGGLGKNRIEATPFLPLQKVEKKKTDSIR